MSMPPPPSGAKTPLTSRNTRMIATSATTITAMTPEEELLCSMRTPPWQASTGFLAGRIPQERGRSVPSFSGLAQLEALDLSGRGLRELGDELDPARVLVGRERVLHERLELVGERVIGRRAVPAAHLPA